MAAKIPYAKLDLNTLLPIYIGTIAKEWNEVEYQLAGLLARIGKIPQGIADIIIGTVGGNKVQRDLIANIAGYRNLPAPLLTKIKSILRRCSKAAKKRNTVVHALYLLRDEHTLLALKNMSVMDQDESAANDFAINKLWLEDALKQIIQLAADIHLLTEALGGSGCAKPYGLRAKQPQRPPRGQKRLSHHPQALQSKP